MGVSSLVLAVSSCLVGGILHAAFTHRTLRKKDRLLDVARDSLDREVKKLEQENQMVKRDANRHANIINSSINPIWVHDRDFRIVFCNLAFSEIVEETEHQHAAIEEVELFSGHRALAQKAWDTGKEQIERRHIIVGGERKLYMIRELPFKREGMIVGYGTNLRDLEEAHSEIQRHVDALSGLLESSTSAMAIYGRDMKLKFYNFSFVALWKLDESWLDTEPSYGEVLETLREKRKLPEQANFQAFKSAQLKLFTGLIEPQEEFFYLPDGKILRAIAIPHALGGILFAYEDVTDRLALERSYNTLIAVQRETLDSLQEGIAVYGENGRIKLCNPNYLKLWNLPTDLTASEPHLREVLDLCRPFFDEERFEAFKDSMISRVTARHFFAIRFERTDNTVIDCTGVPLPDGATLLTFTDVTDSTVVERSLREKNDALEEADRLKTEFLANVSYELRSPLTSISGFAEMLSRQYVGTLNNTQKEYVENIFSSAQHLGHMISDIIDLASIEAGYLKLDYSQVNIREVLEAVISLLCERMKTLDVSLDSYVAPEMQIIRADALRMKQIIFNLLSIAMKRTKQKGRIFLNVFYNAAKQMCIEIEDDGPLHALDVSLMPSQSSGDLGLSIAKRFVEMHGGTLTITYDNTLGTKVLCRIPQADVL